MKTKKTSAAEKVLKKFAGINRKGFSMISESDKMLFWGLVVLTLTACIFVIFAWIGALKSMYLDDSLAPTAYEARLVYSDKCFAYKDPDTGRVYTGTIDPAKFTQDTFDECLPLKKTSSHAMSAVLQTEEGKTEFGMKSPNWEMNSDKIIMRTYVVQVKGYGPGLLTFYHKSGE